eukprot:333559_1
MSEEGIIAVDWMKTQSPIDFELVCIAIFLSEEHKAEHVGGPGDGGTDVLIELKDGRNGTIQCKRYASNHGIAAPIMRVLGIFITTSYFKSPEIEPATRNQIVIWDATTLINIFSSKKCAQIFKTFFLLKKRKHQKLLHKISDKSICNDMLFMQEIE